MNITIYVHEFHPQIGHSRAMQELLNGLTLEQKSNIKSIEIVSFTCGDLDIMFPDFHCPKYFTKISFAELKPFLIKMIYYHAISLVHSFTQGRNRKKIGIGIACLNVNIVNVQFIHEQWRNLFFNNRKLSLIPKIYKKILFAYFALFEKYIYAIKKDIQYIVIANFLKNFLLEKYKTPLSSMALIPSGVNVKEFKFQDITNEELFKNLVLKYPQLENINIAEPIALFVGAFERKGLARTLDLLSTIPNAQLIIIGKSENPKFKIQNLPFKTAHISFTKEVNLFYQISDAFIFPTQYEPFGLVIIEAYVMGLDLVIPIDNVGASEIIPQSEGISYFYQNDDIRLDNFKKILLENKKARRLERLENIKKHSWISSADKFYSILLKK